MILEKYKHLVIQQVDPIAEHTAGFRVLMAINQEEAREVLIDFLVEEKGCHDFTLEDHIEMSWYVFYLDYHAPGDFKI